MPGVIGIARIPSGVAVAAATFDQAQAARDALRITWNPGPNAALSDAQIRDQLRAAAPPFLVPPLGSLSVTREFDFAFAPHAPLEVLTCVADVRADSAEVWYGAKSPIVASQSVAAAIGLPPDRVTLHVVRSGGSFGHRLFFEPAIEAAQISKALGPAGQADVDAQRRHAPRTDAPGQPPQGARDLPARQGDQLRPPARDLARRLLARSRRGAQRRRVQRPEPGRDPDRVRAHPERALRLRCRDADADRRPARVPDRVVAVDLLGSDRNRERSHGRRDRTGVEGGPGRVPAQAALVGAHPGRPRPGDQRRSVGPADAGRDRAGRRHPRGVQVGGRLPGGDRLPGPDPRLASRRASARSTSVARSTPVVWRPRCRAC